MKKDCDEGAVCETCGPSPVFMILMLIAGLLLVGGVKLYRAYYEKPVEGTQHVVR